MPFCSGCSGCSGKNRKSFFSGTVLGGGASTIGQSFCSCAFALLRNRRPNTEAASRTGIVSGCEVVDVRCEVVDVRNIAHGCDYKRNSIQCWTLGCEQVIYSGLLFAGMWGDANDENHRGLVVVVLKVRTVARVPKRNRRGAPLMRRCRRRCNGATR